MLSKDLPVTHLPRFEVVLDAVLEPLALDLHRGHDERVAQEVTRVADALARPETTRTQHALGFIALTSKRSPWLHITQHCTRHYCTDTGKLEREFYKRC